MKITQLELVLTNFSRKNASSQVELFSIFYFKIVHNTLRKDSIVPPSMHNHTYDILLRLLNIYASILLKLREFIIKTAGENFRLYYNNSEKFTYVLWYYSNRI